ncbi:hypothetical protein A5630_21890 [Mycolicibacterium mucogenicum]|uniref:Uncharacterized protein n=1 Tax=Mycolicibacterium mucogenicum TaxID=56689 RepID=A0A1A3H2Q4_MYCMU|nr:hypothetical protein A5630_21890 [Mycolicibacterium mucogenicum]
MFDLCNDPIFQRGIDQAIEKFTVRALTSMIIQAEFCCQCRQFVSLLRRELKIGNSAVEQDRVARDIYISMDTPGQRCEIRGADIDFDDTVASQHATRRRMPQWLRNHRKTSTREGICNGKQQAACRPCIKQRTMRTIRNNSVLSAGNLKFATGGTQGI